ncbi:MAG: FtsX-like permease family protein [Streptosporangiaceae bacterium]
MNTIPAVRAARSGLSGRRVQTMVICLVVLVSTAASTLALGLLVASNAPFDRALAAQHGADVTAAINASSARLAATTRLPGVTAAAGPFAETTVTVLVPIPGGGPGPGPSGGPSGQSSLQAQVNVVGRSSPSAPVDDLTLTSGHWAQGPGQAVWADSQNGIPLSVGNVITVSGVAGNPKLTIVGTANSITGTAQAWVTPAELTALRPAGTPEVSQMLYRFASAGTQAELTADIASLRSSLPPGALLAAQSYLTAKVQSTSSTGPWVPFIVAFGVLGLAMSVLIVVNVVSGAVVAGTRRIGVLKSIGFSPAQVVATYVLQVGVPALAGCVLGVVVGNLLAVPLLGQTAAAYGVGSLAVPAWVDVAVPLAILGVCCAAALLIAMRAGRMSATAAITTGRAPRPTRGYGAHRLLSRMRLLPRPMTLGLAGPFARPARTATTFAAIVFGVVAVTFAVGLGTSLSMVYNDISRSADPVQVGLQGTGPGYQAGAVSGTPSLSARERTVQAALAAQPGTLHYVLEGDDRISVLELSSPLQLIAIGGNPSWSGYALTAGHWYSGNGSQAQVDVNTAFLTDTGTAVGDTYTLVSAGQHITVRIAGAVFAPADGKPDIFGSMATLTGLDRTLTPYQYYVSLKPGTDAGAYVNALGNALGQNYGVNLGGKSQVFAIIIGLIGTLTLLLSAVAGLGVLNTVVLQTRERVHDLGVFKAIGMTPRQTMAMVVSSVAGIGLVAGLIAIPAGVALHNYVLPIMGDAAQTALPSAVFDVYHAPQLILLALAGLVIAVAGAMLPAGWAAKTRTAFALRAE